MQLGGRYKLLSMPLSTGSFGSVFMADDERMPRRVAVKVLHPQHAENPTVRARFRRELEAACRVSHENVVSVFDIGEDPRLGLYYVMELVRGTSLKDYLNGEPLPWLFVHRVATQIVRALHAIHSAGIVHRDLKPQNIMLVERSSLEELVKVLDFGIASLKNPDEDRRDVELTGARMVLGTPPYMSPEQTYMRSDREKLGLDVDARSDVYSLGVILYEMVAGRRPFSGDSHDIVVAHRLTRPMPLDKMVGVAAPREFADLVMRCLAKDPRERPQSAKEVLQALRDCELKPIRRWNEPVVEPDEIQEEPTQGEHVALPIEAAPLETKPRLDVPTRKRTKPLWAPIAALAIGAGLAIAAFMATRPDATETAAVLDTVERGPEPARVEPGKVTAVETPPDRAASAAPNDAVAPDEVAKTSVSSATPPVERVPTQPTMATQREPEPDAPVAVGVGVAAEPDVPAPAPEPLPIEAKRQVGVMLTTQPSGAVVLIDGEERGLTPVTLNIPVEAAQQVEVVLRKDRFEDHAVVLPIGPELSGQTLVVQHTLEKKKVRGPVDPFKDL